MLEKENNAVGEELHYFIVTYSQNSSSDGTNKSSSDIANDNKSLSQAYRSEFTYAKPFFKESDFTYKTGVFYDCLNDVVMNKHPY